MPDDGLLGPAEVRGLARRLGLRPTKARGQNFVVDPNTVRRVVRAAGVGADDVVLEVGPGLGSLTLALLPAVRAVVAVEVDEVLAAALPATVADRLPGCAGRLSVLAADALRVRAADVVASGVAADAVVPPGGPAAGAAPTALVANLPYNVAVPVLLHLLAELPSLRTALVMVQAEVADRLAAGPGSRTYGVPSVKARWYADVARAGAVPRSVFWPVPNVDSGLVRLVRREGAGVQAPGVPALPPGALPPGALPADPAGRRAAVFAVVDAAFAQRRKTLRAALAGWAGSAARAEAVLRAAGVDPSARGEQLDVAAFARIAAAGATTPRGEAGPGAARAVP